MKCWNHSVRRPGRLTEGQIERVDGSTPDIDEVVGAHDSSGPGARRPVADTGRITAMVRNADLVVTCRVGRRLAGIARSVPDSSYPTHLSVIAFAADLQH